MAGKGTNPNDPRAAAIEARLEHLLRDVAADPSRAPRSLADLARRMEVDPATLWRHRRGSDTVDALAEQLVRVGRSGRLPSQRSDGMEGLELSQEIEPAQAQPTGVPLHVMRDQAARHLRAARWALKAFVGRERHQRDLSDLPRALHDLDLALSKAGRAAAELRPLASEWLRLQGADPVGVEPEQLSLHHEIEKAAE